MPRKHKEYLLMGTVIIIGLIVMIMAIAALNQKYQGAFGSLSVKEIYKSLIPTTAPIIIKTAGMAYIGSIITLTISVATLFYGAALIYMSVLLKKDILSVTILTISGVLLLIIIALGLASIITAGNITNTTWLTEHTPKTPNNI